MKKRHLHLFLTIALLHNYAAIAMKKDQKPANAIVPQKKKTSKPVIDLCEDGILVVRGDLTPSALNFSIANAKSVKAILIISGTPSNNRYSAISNVANKLIPGITKVPGYYYTLPYLAMFRFPYYLRTADQIAFNIEKIPKDLPIILTHRVKDEQRPFKDVQALYAALKNNGNTVYLAEKHDKVTGKYNGRNDSNFPKCPDPVTKEMLQSVAVILAHHGLHKLDTLLPVAPYQPTVKKEWTDHWNEIVQKETRLWCFDTFLKATLCGLIIYLLQTAGMAEKVFERYFAQ